jgi:hypothetical protein
MSVEGHLGKNKARPDASHNHQCRCLIETIFQTVDCIRLVTKSNFLKCEDIIDIRVDSCVSNIFGYVHWNMFIFEFFGFQGLLLKIRNPFSSKRRNQSLAEE